LGSSDLAIAHQQCTPWHGGCAGIGTFIAGIAVCLAGGGQALARPLTTEETQIFRAAPTLKELDKDRELRKPYLTAQALASKLGKEGNFDALPLFLELRQVPLLTTFAGAYTGPATPELEAFVLRHMDDPQINWRLIAMLRQLRSPVLFDALLAALPAGKIDCTYLLRAAITAEVPDVEPRLSKLLPVIHPAAGKIIAQRFADRQYLAGENLLIDLLRRTPLDDMATISDMASQLTRLPTDAALNATARKLIEIAKLPEDKNAQPRSGQISIRPEDIPKDGLLCSTEWWRTPKPLGDARSREVGKLLRILSISPPDATLDRSLFGPAAMGSFSPQELKAVEAMLAERARVEPMAHELTPENLIFSIRSSLDLRLMKTFIARGIDVNAPTRQGERPLMHAAQSLRLDVAALLLDAGADPNLANQDWEGNTALHIVSRHGGVVNSVIESGERVMKLLLAHKADPKARNKFGATPLQFAANRRPELMLLLLDAGADVNAADVNGTTPLHGAAHGGQGAIARLLLDRGANVNAEEMGGVTPLLIARDRHDKELESLFESRGGRVNQVYFMKREAVKFLLLGPH
jgi:ankyrin repeat protein